MIKMVKMSETLQSPVNGSAVESPKLKPGEYTLKERASSVTSVTGQTHNLKTYKVTVVAGKKGDAAPVVKVENKPVMGEITVTKKRGRVR